jgi:hypothetical protein
MTKRLDTATRAVCWAYLTSALFCFVALRAASWNMDPSASWDTQRGRAQSLPLFQVAFALRPVLLLLLLWGIPLAIGCWRSVWVYVIGAAFLLTLAGVSFGVP